MSPSVAIELSDVTKDFVIGLGGVRLRALNQLNLQIERGEIFGLLGPNGSGKSTTIKLLLGFMRPTLGHCAVFGLPCDRVEARASIGYLPDSPQFPTFLSGQELVRFYAELSGLSGVRLEEAVRAAIETVGLSHAANRRVGTYSKGMLQRIGLAQAIVHDPALLILDEPTAGVDPVATAMIIATLRQLRARGTTILLTSHLLEQVAAVCDRVAMLDHGHLVGEQRVHQEVADEREPALLVAGLPPEDRAELDQWLTTRGYPPTTAEAARPPGADAFLPWRLQCGAGAAFARRRVLAPGEHTHSVVG